uniref:phenylalanine--tRNA ligase n=1 Tax=Caloglossa beccarii TaxID=131038 RepID=A0A1Z1M9F5_9FLOR|nr:Phenylalanine-tRNA ligase beta subunit [Caloglossa beccarii]ARW62374.1 Phenylalanine-tRNA ligase beta subunit [Caloglossa beccarii]
MKFSWKVLNSFINLEKIPTEEFISKLNLSGLEVEEFKDQPIFTDKSIDLNITANRKELFCIINLAIELSTIFYLPLQLKLKNIKLIEPEKKSSFLYLKCIKSHKVHYLKNRLTPNWLQNYLKISGIQPISLIRDIQKYIEIKWGHKFHVFNLEKINNIEKKNLYINYINNVLNNKKDYLYFYNEKQNKKIQNIILYFAVYEINKSNINNSSIVFNQAYEETIKLITTYTQSVVSKSTEYYYDDLNANNKNQTLNIKKNEIKNLLGPIKNTKLTFLQKQQILNILQQLNFKPIYFKAYKIFKIQIPEYRQHDLKRNIDIIEEIGRIYGFEKFLNKLPTYQNKGNISLNYLNLKIIRNSLLQIGFNEVINLSFNNTNNFKSNYNEITVRNPLGQEQISLRINILDSLIKIHKQNINNKIFHTEIFEIGKIFYRNKLNYFMEESYLGGLIHNNNYSQANWSNSQIPMNWFHAKGIIEQFLEIIKAQTTWKKAIKLDNSITFTYNKNYYHPNKTLLIYNDYNQESIGIFGELYNKNLKEIKTRNTYLFEINITKLLKCINYNKHYNYIMYPYSSYPSVSRDISIKVRKKTSIKKIKKFFLDRIIDLAESITIINEYYNTLNKQRSICIRIIYKSLYKTLNNIDLQNIDLNIKEILEALYLPEIKSKL